MPAKISIPQDRLAEFCRRNHIRQMALVGSVLRDDFRSDSDVDVLVEFEPNAKIGMFALTDMQDELARIFHRSVDLVPKAGLKEVIRQAVMDSALVVYAA